MAKRGVPQWCGWNYRGASARVAVPIGPHRERKIERIIDGIGRAAVLAALALMTLAASVLLFCSAAEAQVENASAPYSRVADSLQAQTHNRFLNGSYYRQNNGGVQTFHYWWNAHALDVLADAYLRTRNPVYSKRMKNLLHGIFAANGNTYINKFYDDMEWLGLASLRAYELTGDAEYLSVAELLWTDIKGGLTSGFFTWNKDCHPHCKNTIGSTPAIILGARLHALRANDADLQTIRSVYANVKARMVDPSTGTVFDGVDLSTGVLDKRVFSYNQGMYIGAGLELYKVTGDSGYLDDALRTANRVLETRSPNGMIFAHERGGGDGGLFKGILVRYLALLAREGNIPAANRTRYNDAIKHNAKILNSIGIRRPEMIVGTNWAVQPALRTDFSTQLSGLMLMEAAAVIDLPMVYQHNNYNGRSSALPAGGYNTAALAARGVANNDVTSLTVPPGWRVTLFDGDNFTGPSLVKTSNDTRLVDDGWNDRASSIVITATDDMVNVGWRLRLRWLLD